MRNRAEILPPANRLKARAVNPYRGLDFKLPRDFVAKVERLIEKSSDAFLLDMATRLRRLRRHHAQVISNKASQEGFFSAVLNDSLEIKGIGGTIGYPLLTYVARSLSEFVGNPRNQDAAANIVIQLHTDTLYVVVADHITGRGGELEQEVLDGLQKVVVWHAQQRELAGPAALAIH